MLKFPFAILCMFDVFIFSAITPINANENTVFLYNRFESCKPMEYYDENYFMCRECDPQSKLVPSKNGKAC